MNADSIGMCHNCFTSNIKVVNYEGNVLCQSCFGNKFPNRSFLNLPEPTFDDLKRKFQKDWR